MQPSISTWEVLFKQDNKIKSECQSIRLLCSFFFYQECGCKLPFRHFTFQKDPVSRAKWTELVNRKDSPNDSTPRELRERSVICSEYFVGGEPTRSNPYPILKMGNNIVSLHGMLSLQPPRLKLRAVNQHLFY